MGEKVQNQPSSDDVKQGIKKLKEWISSKNIKNFLKGKKSGVALVSGMSFNRYKT